MVEEKKAYLISFPCPNNSEHETGAGPYTKHDIETALEAGEIEVHCKNECDVVKVPLDPQTRMKLKKLLG